MRVPGGGGGGDDKTGLVVTLARGVSPGRAPVAPEVMCGEHGPRPWRLGKALPGTPGSPTGYHTEGDPSQKLLNEILR